MKKKNQENTVMADPTPENLARIQQLRLMDDDFFSEALDGKIEAVQFILNTILERDDLRVLHTSAQKTYRSAENHSVTMDIWAEDTAGRAIDIEIQQDDHGAGEKRARMHSSMLDRNLLKKGQPYDTLPETFVIFITENDVYHNGLPLYHIDRKISELDNAYFGDDAHIIYVNGAFMDTSHPVGQLMHDFHCTNAENMYSPLLANEVRDLKETKGGQKQMSRILDEMCEEVAHNDAVKFARKLLALGTMSAEQIAELTELPLEEVLHLA